MKIKKFEKKKLLDSKRYPYKSFEECPNDKKSDFARYLYLTAMRGGDEGLRAGEVLLRWMMSTRKRLIKQ